VSLSGPRARVTSTTFWVVSQVISRRATGPTRKVVSGASGTDVETDAPPMSELTTGGNGSVPAMPRSFDMATEYEGSVEQVHRAFRDKRYWLARLTESGADAYSLDKLILGEDGGIDIVTTWKIFSNRLPGVVQQFHRGDLAFIREEMWSPIRDGEAAATIKLTIEGAPANLSGSAVLAAANPGTGSRLEFNATVQVDIPLVGGKIENFIGGQLVQLLIQEQRFTTEWIAENA
jgi:hypothetical protein